MITALESMTPADRADFVATLTEERDTARDDLATAIARNGLLRNQLADAKAERDAARDDLAASFKNFEIVRAERDKARNDHASAAEDLTTARQIIDAAEEAIRFAGIVAPGTLTDRIRALALFHRAAEEASNDKSDRLEEADREIDRLTGQLSDLRGDLSDAIAENTSLRANVRRLALMVARLSGAR